MDIQSQNFSIDNYGLKRAGKKYRMKDLKPLAKKYGISLRCAKKIDVLKALPPEGLAELEGK